MKTLTIDHALDTMDHARERFHDADVEGGYADLSARLDEVRQNVGAEEWRFFTEDVDDRFEALSRVVGVRVGDTTKAYPFETISRELAVDDEIDGTAITVWWGAPDTADSLDANRVADGRGIGTGIAFLREVDGRTLTFAANGDDTFSDVETGSTWNLLGRAVAGPLGGTELDTALHQNEFWFAWAAFNQGAAVFGLD